MSIQRSFEAVRRRTLELVEPLSPEDCLAQSMPDASPAKWHLAHTTWFFETFVLEAAGWRGDPLRPEWKTLFNSYYQTVGEPFPRPRRGMLTRPSLEDVLEQRTRVEEATLGLLDRGVSDDLLDVVVTGLHHEQQHQELLLTDVKHLLSENPLGPCYRGRETNGTSQGAPPTDWVRCPEGAVRVGADDAGFAFDNERPRHDALLRPAAVATRPVTNAEWIAFLEDGGYENPLLWLSDGWDAARANGWRAPLYWRAADGGWESFTLSGWLPVDPDEPVCHVSLYEADAFARWAGARLPSEVEWESVAAASSIEGNFADSGRFHPAPATAGFFGDVWEWTSSPYAPYPGYRPPEGALGEYNGKFMCNQFVLRGGSCATPASHVRPTYRNFFPPAARWQFSGLRLARDL